MQEVGWVVPLALTSNMLLRSDRNSSAFMKTLVASSPARPFHTRSCVILLSSAQAEARNGSHDPTAGQEPTDGQLSHCKLSGFLPGPQPVPLDKHGLQLHVDRSDEGRPHSWLSRL